MKSRIRYVLKSNVYKANVQLLHIAKHMSKRKQIYPVHIMFDLAIALVEYLCTQYLCAL